MDLTIRRGANEIGGSCVQLEAQGRSLLLDLGMPLVNPDRTEFDEDALRNKPRTTLVAERVLPDVKGLYDKGRDCAVEAVLLSHSHGDHYGLGRYVRKDVPFLMSYGTAATINTFGAFVANARGLANMQVLTDVFGPHQLGPFTVRARPVDHSAFDALAFEVEADGKRVFYTGDLRFHGRVRRKSEHLIERPPRDVDAMLMEGSCLGRMDDEYPCRSEDDVEEALVETIQGKRNLAVVFASGQNVDRIHTVYRAARKLGRELVIDLYTAALLNAWKSEHDSLIQYDTRGVRVVFWRWHKESLEASNPDFFWRIVRSGHGIKKEIVLERPDRYVLMSSVKPCIKYLVGRVSTVEDLTLVWSKWRGYLKPGSHGALAADFCRDHGLELHPIHTSGHADVEALRRLVQAVKPRRLIPIHTFHGDEYGQFGAPVTRLDDGETLEL